jgi:BirA family biotin operon repressor/biotin-[acetyl-CoA-carboxylase] ligase
MKIPGAPHILHLKTTTSTQSLARQLAEDGAPSGTLVWADRQTRGRGRLQRTWSSANGGLYFSWLVRPRIAPSSLGKLSLEVGRQIARAMQKLSGAEIALKLPNDVLARPRQTTAAPRKLAGILIEAAASGRHLEWLVIGVGVNVNNALPRGVTATSLKKIRGKPQNITRVLKACMTALSQAL